MAAWTSLLTGLLKKPETWGAITQGVGSILGATGAGKDQQQQARENTQSSQIDQYSRDYWSNQAAQQAAINQALAGYDPLQDQMDMYKFRAQSDIRNDPGGSVRNAPVTNAPGFLAGKVGRVTSYAPSASTTAMASPGALAKVLQNKQSNMIAQSKGQVSPLDIGGILGVPSTSEIQAIQEALGTEKSAAMAAQEKAFNDYLAQMSGAYNAQAQNAGGAPSNAGKWIGGAAAAASPFLLKWAKSAFKTPTTAQRTGAPSTGGTFGEGYLGHGIFS